MRAIFSHFPSFLSFSLFMKWGEGNGDLQLPYEARHPTKYFIKSGTSKSTKKRILWFSEIRPDKTFFHNSRATNFCVIQKCQSALNMWKVWSGWSSRGKKRNRILQFFAQFLLVCGSVSDRQKQQQQQQQLVESSCWKSSNTYAAAALI